MLVNDLIIRLTEMIENDSTVLEKTVVIPADLQGELNETLEVAEVTINEDDDVVIA